MNTAYALIKWLHVVNATILFGFGAGYARGMRCWFALGWPAFLSLLAIFWLMIAKPRLW